MILKIGCFNFSLHLTTMCLRYTPTIVACVCIHLACKWSNYRIPLSAQQREWFSYIDAEATHDLLDKLTDEFLAIFDKCPSKLKNKIRDITQASQIWVKTFFIYLVKGNLEKWVGYFLKLEMPKLLFSRQMAT